MSKTKKLLVLCAVLALAAVQVPTCQANPAAAPAPVQMSSLSGTVVETMNSGGYTYVHINTGEQMNWAAIPTTKVEVGSKVTLAPGMVMHNFPSKSLGRTFEAILFSQGITKQ